jgi:hypothetical protein
METPKRPKPKLKRFLLNSVSHRPELAIEQARKMNDPKFKPVVFFPKLRMIAMKK